MAGGINHKHGELDSCEVYNVEYDTWSVLHQAVLPKKTFALNLLAVGKRHVYGFGLNKDPNVQQNTDTLIYLDSWNYNKGWTAVEIRNELETRGCQYGFLPLGCEDETQSFLVFGGIQNVEPYEKTSDTGILTIDLRNMNESQVRRLTKQGKPILMT